MKLVHPLISEIINLSNESKVNILVIENQKLFTSILTELYGQINNCKGRFVFSIDNSPKEISKNIEIITQGGGDGTEADIYFVTKNNDFDEALEITKDIGKLLGARNVKGLKNLAMISLVGNLKDTKLDISSKILNILNKENVKPIVLSGSDIKISVLLEEIFFKKIVNEFHKKFIN